MCLTPALRRGHRVRQGVVRHDPNAEINSTDPTHVVEAKLTAQRASAAQRQAAAAAAEQKAAAAGVQLVGGLQDPPKRRRSKAPTQATAPPPPPAPPSPSPPPAAAVAIAAASTAVVSSPSATKRDSSGAPKPPAASPAAPSSSSAPLLADSDEEDGTQTPLPPPKTADRTHEECMRIVETADAPTIVPKDGVATACVDGETFALTGHFLPVTFASPVVRKGLGWGQEETAALIHMGDGEVAPRVRGGVDWLVAGSLPGYTKVAEAQRRGIPIITAAALEKMLEGSSEDPELATFGPDTQWSPGWGKKAKAPTPPSSDSEDEVEETGPVAPPSEANASNTDCLWPSALRAQGARCLKESTAQAHKELVEQIVKEQHMRRSRNGKPLSAKKLQDRMQWGELPC